MTRSIRIITIVGVALVLVPSAFAKGERFQEAPQWQQALMARSEAMNQKYLPEKSSPVIVGERFQGTPQWQQALTARSEAMNQKYLPEKSSPVIVGERFQGTPQWQQALTARSEGLNRQNGLGEYAVSSIDAREQALTTKSEVQLASTPYPDWFERAAANAAARDSRQIVVDDRFDLHPQDVPTPVATTSSGREIDFPQVGVGLGIGVLLALGLYLAIRFTRVRPVAH